MVKHEESLGAHDATVHSNIFGVPVGPRERSFSSFTLSNVVLERSEL